MSENFGPSFDIYPSPPGESLVLPESGGDESPSFTILSQTSPDQIPSPLGDDGARGFSGRTLHRESARTRLPMAEASSSGIQIHMSPTPIKLEREGFGLIGERVPPARESESASSSSQSLRHPPDLSSHAVPDPTTGQKVVEATQKSWSVLLNGAALVVSLTAQLFV